jgi:hypothetical protein
MSLNVIHMWGFRHDVPPPEESNTMRDPVSADKKRVLSRVEGPAVLSLNPGPYQRIQMIHSMKNLAVLDGLLLGVSDRHRPATAAFRGAEPRAL